MICINCTDAASKILQRLGKECFWTFQPTMCVGKWIIWSFPISSLMMFLWKQMKEAELCEGSGSRLIIQALFCNLSVTFLDWLWLPLPCFFFFFHSSAPRSRFWTWDSLQIFSVCGFVACLAHPSSPRELLWDSTSFMGSTAAVDWDYLTIWRRAIYDINPTYWTLFGDVSRQWWTMSFSDDNIDYNPLKSKSYREIKRGSSFYFLVCCSTE